MFLDGAERFITDAEKKMAAPELQTPLNAAQQSVQKMLTAVGDEGSAILVMGENHYIFSHQVTQALALKELAAKQKNTTLFMEYPHNRLYNILLDRGYGAGDAEKLAEHISVSDDDGHITAKALIGGNSPSLRGSNFAAFESQMLLQTAMHHDIGIVYADAARVYPEDFCMDFSDRSTNETALKLNARRALEGETGPDDMLIRNTHMSATVKARLENGGVGLLATGAAHCFGIDDAGNGLHHYNDSLAKRFQKLGLTAVMLSMLPDESLPPDYEPPAGGQTHIYDKPGPLTLISDMSDSDIHDFLADNGLNPDLYDPRKFAERYKMEFDRVLRQAEIDLNVQTPVLPQTAKNMPADWHPA